MHGGHYFCCQGYEIRVGFIPYIPLCVADANYSKAEDPRRAYSNHGGSDVMMLEIICQVQSIKAKKSNNATIVTCLTEAELQT